MRYVTKIEEGAMTVLSICLIAKLNLQISWWWYIPLFFSPDISLIGIAMKNKTGTILYGAVHNKTVPIIAGLIGLILKIDYLILAGLILFGHSSFDRLLGFEMKIKEDTLAV